MCIPSELVHTGCFSSLGILCQTNNYKVQGQSDINKSDTAYTWAARESLPERHHTCKVVVAHEQMLEGPQLA